MQAFALSALSRRLSRKLSLPFFNTIPFKKEVEKETESALTVRYKPEGLERLSQSTKFSQKELRVLYRGFKQDCPSGVAKEHTFKEIFSHFFPQSNSDSYAHYMFNVIDEDRDGSVSFEDFIMGLSVLARGSEEDKLCWIFSMYDINGDGVISRGDMLDFISAVYGLMGNDVQPCIDDSTFRDHVDEIFQKMDLDKDGVISIEEFMEACKSDETILTSLNLFDTVF